MPSFWKTGMRITSARLNRTLPISVSKSIATSRNTTTTVADDPDLLLDLLVSTVYDIKGFLLVTTAANAAGDFKYGWAWTGTMTVTMPGVGPDESLASGTSVTGNWARNASDTSTPSTTLGYGSSTTGVTIPVNTRVVVGATEGRLSLQWAQLSSNANNTTLEVGSQLTAFPVLFN